MSARAVMIAIGTSTVWAAMASACSESAPRDPFLVHDAGTEDVGDSEPVSDAEPDAAPDAGPGLGRACLDDGQCDDGHDCTLDECDLKLERCRHTPRDELCQDGRYCDGEERCDVLVGCIEGEPVSCSDNTTCTIDRCVEESRSCEHEARDADGDGDGVWNCMDGGDCNDQNPRVSSLHAEVCDNGVDDDCDEEVDEEDCMSPAHDRCDDALEIKESGSYSLSFLATAGDYGSSCVEDLADPVDVVLDLVVPDGPPQDVDVLVSSDDLSLALVHQQTCGDANTEQDCQVGVQMDSGRSLARLRAFALEPGRHSLIVFADREGEASLRVSFEDAEEPPLNETCGTASELLPGEPVVARPYLADIDHESACASAVGDLVYGFEVSEAADVHLYASSLDDFGRPLLSLRDGDCAPISSELTCRSRGAQAHLFARAVEPGAYFVVVSSDAPAETTVLLDMDPPSQAPGSETCTDPPTLPDDESITVGMADHTDDIEAGCLVGSVDAAFELEVSEPQDVLLLQSFSESDVTGLALARVGCAGTDTLVCESSRESPLRLYAHQVPAGEYRVIAESAEAHSVRLDAFTRPRTPAVLVPFSDTCDQAITIPETGGTFVGNTATVNADYGASCDFVLRVPPGAPDQLLKLALSRPRRVILDMRGSEYETLLLVRSGDECPGEEVVQACAPDFGSGYSYLDLSLDTGDYYIQIDGYDGAAGPWQLEVFTREL